MSKNKSFSETSANRYSLALYELAKESSELDEIEKNCSSFLTLIFNNNEFQSLIKNPTVKKDELLATVLKISDQYKLNSLLIKSSYIISETSKNSKGQVESYKSQIILSLIIKDNNKVIESKNFSKEFSYNTKDKKFELVRYQNEVKENLIFKIIEDIILYMNI